MIRVNAKYGIEALPDQYVVYEFRIGQKGKSEGVEKQEILGYFSGLSGACRAIRDDMVRSSLAEADMSLHDAIRLLQRTDDEFWQSIRKECRDD